MQFLTFKSEEFEQNAINKMEIELPPSDITKQTPSQGTYVHVVMTELMIKPSHQTVIIWPTKTFKFVTVYF